MEAPENIQAPQQQKPLLSIGRFIKRTVLYSLLAVMLTVVVGTILVFVYEDDVKAIVITELNKCIRRDSFDHQDLDR